MKQYFAKYLPVEGEIKEEEIGISINNATYTHHDHLGKDYGKPAKLFLCSRDIQVGDKDYYYIDSTQNNKIEKAPDYWDIINIKPEPNGHVAVIFNNNAFLWIEEVFKVVGEISPEAIWVKEGDEFDKDEVEEWWEGSLKKGIDEWFDGQSLKDGDKIILKIKGLCGHFH